MHLQTCTYYTQTHRHTRHPHTSTDIHTQRDRHPHIQRDIDRHTDRQADTHTQTHTHTSQQMLISKIYNPNYSGESEDDKFRVSPSYSDFKASNLVILIFSLKLKEGAGEMVRGLSGLVLFQRTKVWFPRPCNSSSRDSKVLFQPLQALALTGKY